MPSDANHPKWATWMLRPIVLFAAAHAIVTVVHEAAHALTAYALKVPFTLFHLYVQIDRSVGTPGEHAVIGVAGPLFCLGIGCVCWVAYRKAKGSSAELPLLYFAWFGIGTFFGNLLSTPSVGDFSRLAGAYQWPMPVRYGVALVGLLAISILCFLVGTELRKWAPMDAGRARAMIGMVALPVIIGTVISILIFLPMPSAFAVGRAGESAFWIFGAVGTFVSRKQPADSSRSLGVGFGDFAVLLVAVFLVRVMARGIPFAP